MPFFTSCVTHEFLLATRESDPRIRESDPRISSRVFLLFRSSSPCLSPLSYTYLHWNRLRAFWEGGCQHRERRKEGKNQGTIFREEEENYSLKLLASFSQGVRNIRCSLSYSTDWTLSAMVNVTLCSRSCFTVPWNQFRITFLFLCECSLLLLPFYCKNSLLEDGKWGTIICRPVSLGQDYSWIAMLFSLTKPICCWNSMLSVGWYNVVHFGTLKLDSDILIPIAAGR